MAHDDDPPDPEEPVVVELTDVLDLHAFNPRDVGTLVPDFLDDAAARGHDRVRIVHGKGTGVLRERVHALLRRHPRVAEFRLVGDGGGGWGATVVILRAGG